MGQETETKILDVDPSYIASTMEKIGAMKVADVFMIVDWYGPAELYGGTTIMENKDPWFLRIRTSTPGTSELTWKSISDVHQGSRKTKEINLGVSDREKAGEFLKALGLKHYAHQEKKRISWTLKEWRFDLDQYPQMPAFLEIEGPSYDSLHKAIRLLSLESHDINPYGERLLIQNRYRLDWYNMKF